MNQMAPIRKKPEPWTPERIERLRGLWTKGITVTAMGAQLGVSPATVRETASRYNLGPRAPHAIETIWTEDRVATLTKLWHEGLSCLQIAAEMAITRNMVIGKVHRLGLSMRRQPRVRAPSERPKPRKPPTRPKIVAVTKEMPRPDQMPVLQAPAPAARDVARIGLMELSDAVCRWPIGEVGTPAFGFCGDTVRNGSPYCAAHHALAYVPRKTNV